MADIDKDILVLKIKDNEGYPPASNFDYTKILGEVKNYPIGEKVFAIGYPHGIGCVITQGILGGFTDNFGSAKIIYSASTTFGNSGGALITEDGKFIGITTSTHKKSQNLNFAIPLSEINGSFCSEEDTLCLNKLSLYLKAYNYLKSANLKLADLILTVILIYMAMIIIQNLLNQSYYL